MRRIKLFCSIFLCGILLSTNVISAYAKESKKVGKTITVEWPGEGEDASPSIQKAVEEAGKAEGPVTIEFEKGKQYEVFPETAYHETGYYISNAATKEENADGERWSAIFMKDMEDVTVDGREAMLNIHGVMTPLLLDGCKNITFENLHVDWARPTMSEFNIVEVGDDYAKVQVLEGSLYELENGGTSLRWVSEKRPDGEYYWTLSGGLVGKHDPEQNTSRRSSFPYPSKYVDEGNGVLKLEYGYRPSLKVGENYQFRSGSRDQVGSFIHKCENVKFNNMGFHYMHGLGIVSQYTKNIAFDNIDCTPRKETGRICASSADFLQVSGCSGLVSVTDSKFSGAHDDVFNIHGTHLRIVNKDESANKITVQFMQERSWGFQAFDVGDEIEFVKPDTMLNYASNKVKSFNRLDDYRIELTLEEPLPEEIGLNADVVENITATPDVLLKGNYADNITTRGVLCTTRGEVLIEDNTFYKNGMSGVLLEDDVRAWYESGPVKNMIIRNNKFVECGGPQIFSNPQTSVYDPLKTVHSNIQIVGNEFTGNSSIEMLSTKDIVIKDNIFTDGGSVKLSACNGFEIGENKGVRNVSVSNSLNDKSLADFKVKGQEHIETIDRTGMTASANNERSGYSASNLLDDKAETIWHTDWENIPSENPYVEIDLNGSKTFNRVSYMPRQGETGGNVKAYELWIKEKASDSEYVKIAEGGGWSVDGAEKQIDLDTPVTAEAVKFVSIDSVYDSSNRLIASGAEINFRNVVKSSEAIPTGKKVSLGYEAVGTTGAPADLTGADFTYSSSDEAVAEIDEKGIITGKKAGTSKITVTVKAYGATFTDTTTVTVTEEVYTAAEQITIMEPEGNCMKVSVVPETAAADVSWSVERISGGKPSITEDGTLMTTAAGRMKVTAYSKNDGEIKDEMMIVAGEQGEASQEFQWVRENKNNWSLDAEKALKLKLEPGALWSGTTNTAKNILTKEIGKEDCSIVVKMNYKPEADYAEAGVAFYADDDNYVFLSRKKHSGYGGNIFSVIAEKNGNAEESPAVNKVMDNIASKDIYLKLEKSGTQYSGFYSEDGVSWNPVWEDRTLDWGIAPKAAIVGYGGGNETVVFEYLQIDEEQHTFESLVPEMNTAKAILTSIETPLTAERFVGTVAEELNLPANLEVTWNETYQERIPVQWNLTDYHSELETGTYEYQGTIVGAAEEDLGEGIKLTLSLRLTANKQALTETVNLASLRNEAAYTEETWGPFAEKLAAAQALLENEDATQAETDTLAAELTAAMDSLEIKGTLEGLRSLSGRAKEIAEQYKTQLYDDEMPSEEWQNHFYSSERYDGLIEETAKADDVIEKLDTAGAVQQPETQTEPEAEANPETQAEADTQAEPEEQIDTEASQPLTEEQDFTEEEKVELVTAIEALQSAQDAFVQSRHTVEIQELKTWLNVVTDPAKYTQENWDTLMSALKAGASLIDGSSGENYTQKQVADATAAIKAAYENQTVENPDDGDGDGGGNDGGNNGGNGSQGGGQDSSQGSGCNSGKDNADKGTGNKGGSSTKAPQTGDNSMNKVVGLLLTMLVSAGFVIAKKRSVKSK